MNTYQLFMIIGTMLGVGGTIIAFIMANTRRLDVDRRTMTSEAATDRRTADARVDTYLAEAAADRRAIQATLDGLRTYLQQLAERQVRLEGTAAD